MTFLDERIIDKDFAFSKLVNLNQNTVFTAMKRQTTHPATVVLIHVFCIVYPAAGVSRCFTLLRGVSTTTPLCQGVPGAVWKLGKLNHIAIAVPDMERATALYRDVLGATVSDKVPLPEHGVYTVFVELGNTKLELLHPLGDKSPISGFLQKNKSGGMHHICIEVRGIRQ